MKRRAASVVLALAISAAFLYLAARNVRLDELSAALSKARWPWVLAMAATSLLDLAVRSARWKLLLSRHRPALWPLARLETIGLAVNNVLFLRLGELARAFLASRQFSVPFATAFSSIAVERALDVTALLTLFLAAALALPQFVPVAFLRAGFLAWAGALAALALLALAERPLSAGGAWERRLKPWPRLHELILQLAAGAAVLKRPGPAATAAAMSLLLWAIDAFFYWAAARALGLDAFVDYPRAVLILSWAAGGAFLPAVPGAFGTFEAMVKAIVQALGAAPAEAFAYAVFSHMVGYLLVTALGLGFLYKVGLSLGELRRALEARK